MNISLPPGITCSPGVPCFNSGCYARKFYNLRTTCKLAWDHNYRLVQLERNFYFTSIGVAIARANIKLFRWHVSGDLIDMDYLVRMNALARTLPKVKFLAFTKQYGIIEQFITDESDQAENLSIVISTWPGLMIPPALDHLPTAWMRDPVKPDVRIPEKATECDGGCEKCGLCWGLKHGESVVFDKH